MTATATQPSFTTARQRKAMPQERRSSAVGAAKASAVALGQAVKYADQWIQPFRDARKNSIAIYVNKFGGTKPAKAQPVNLTFGMVQAIMPQLSIEPSSNVQPVRWQHQAEAAKLRIRIDQICRRMGLDATIDEVVMAALFGGAYTYTNLVAADYRPDTDVQDPGEAWVDPVSQDDYVCDPFAMRRSTMKFEGHKIRLPFEWAMEQRDLFDRAMLEKVGAFQAKARDMARADAIGKQRAPRDGDRWVEDVELYSVYLGADNEKDRRTVLIPPDPDQTEGFILEAEWRGPEEGPYDALTFLWVPDQTQPTTAASQTEELNDVTNQLLRKVIQQAVNQKDITVSDAEDVAGGDAIRNANDGDHVTVAAGKMKPERLSTGGANEQMVRAVEFFKGMHNWLAGNSDAVGGLAKQSGTLGQDQLLFSNASARLQFWRGRIIGMLSRIMRKLGFFELSDTISERTLSDGQGSTAIDLSWNPEDRAGLTTDDFIVTGKAYGIQSDTPEQQHARVVGIIRDVVIPLAPLAMQSGKIPNVPELIRLAFETGNIPHAEELFVDAPQPAAVQQQASEFAGMGGAGGGSGAVTQNISVGGTPRPVKMGNPADVMAKQPGANDAVQE